MLATVQFKIVRVPISSLKTLNTEKHKLKTLPVVLYGCETSSFKLKEEHRLRAFENMVLRRIYGPKREKLAEDWRKTAL
jgi:hypothetical protein